jgi:hypothetical protein
MATTVTVAPSVGQGVSLLQAGPGAAPGYSAIDLRRFEAISRREGLLSESSYLVSQRGAGANGTVDVAASTGDGFVIQGDSITAQGVYLVPPHNAVINVDIAAGDPTNPRNDLVVLEVKDDTHDAGGLNLARVRVITGTPNASAALTDAFGVNGTPALPISAVPLAVVRQPASGVNITNAMIDDRRFRTAGKSNIATTESRTNVAYGALATPDRVRNLVLPADGLIYVAYEATWQESVNAAARIALFLSANQLKRDEGNAGPIAHETGLSTGFAAIDTNVSTYSGGLTASSSRGSTAYTGDVATGQIIFAGTAGGFLAVFAAAGVYDVSVQSKSTSGSVTAKNRKLWVWTHAFPA